MKEPFELFGIECDRGWERLYKPVIDKINEYNKDHPEEPDIEIHQIKEKWGGAFVYLCIIRTKRNLGPYRSGFQSTKKVSTRATNKGGWVRTLCDRCREKYTTN